jgi:hypothetical protein
MTRKRQRSVLKLFGLLRNWMKTEKHSKRKLHSSRLIHYATLLAATSTNKSQSSPPSTPISSSCIPNWRACLESRLETTKTATARERSNPRKKREGKKNDYLTRFNFISRQRECIRLSRETDHKFRVKDCGNQKASGKDRRAFSLSLPEE